MRGKSRIALLRDRHPSGSALHRHTGVVEDDAARDPAEEFHGQHDAFQKRLRVLLSETHNEGSATVGQAGTEQVNLCPVSLAEVDIGLAEVNLHGIPRFEIQGDKSMGEILPPSADQSPYGTFGTGEAFLIHKPLVDASRRVVLLLAGFQGILQEALVDELDDVLCHDSGIAAVVGTMTCIGVSLAVLGNCITRYTKILGNLALAYAIDQIFLSDCCVFFHSDTHLTTSSSWNCSSHYRGYWA